MVNIKPQGSPLHYLQQQFALIDICGEIRVIDLLQINNVLNGKLSGDLAFYRKQESNVLMKRVIENLSFSCKPQAVIDDFWVSPLTKMYQGTAFSPKSKPANIINFWVGHRESNQSGNHSFILVYLYEVICGSDINCYSYLIRFLAHMVQKPEEKPGIMIVLLGGQGTGKGMFFRLLRGIWPRTTLQVTDIDQVVGRFNACLERNYTVCMDEALFAGDRKSLDRLKSLITEPLINIEQKYQPSRNIESVHRFFAASNHEHFANVENDDRRFMFLRVSNIHQQDTEYFAKLITKIDDPITIGSFINYLQSVDISSFNIRNKPKSIEHLLQKIKSLQGFERYWYEVLLMGDFNAMESIYSLDCDLTWSNSIFVPTTTLVGKYKEFNKNSQRHNTVQSTDIVTSVRKLCPTSFQDRQLYKQGNFTSKVQMRGLQLPDLATARIEFEAYVGGKIQWD